MSKQVTCEKCGNTMIPRKIFTHNVKKKECITVIQCIVCRFWQKL